MEIIELVLDKNNPKGVFALSVVENPAMEADFICLSSEQNVELKSMDETKHLLLGATMIPDKRIYRRNNDGKEYYIYFSKETVREASQLFMKLSNQNNATIEHLKPIEGMTVVESWIVEDSEKDKTALYGLKYPVGTWVVAMKADNEEIYRKALKGEVKGFSIEAQFVEKVELSMQDEDERILAELKELLKNV